MMRPSRLNAKIGLILIALSLLLLPAGTFRPNRIVKGVPVRLETLLGELWPLYLMLLLAILGVYAFIKPSALVPILSVIPWLLALLPGLLLILLSRVLLPGAEYDAEIARFSLGSGFWLLLAGILLIQSSLTHSGWAIALTISLASLTVAFGWSPQLALYKEFLNVRTAFYSELLRHLLLALSSVFFAILPGILLGYWCHKHNKAREWILGVVNLFQVIPTLSFLGLIMIPLAILSKSIPFLAELGIKGIGFAPAFIVLTLYCLLPITANSFAGFDQIESAVVDSATAMGMKSRQIMRRVLIPLALPVIFSGVRTAVTQNIGNTILAGLIGGGGMGALIFLGLAQSSSDLVILGTIPVVLMALVMDALFKKLEERLTKRMGNLHDSAEASI